MKICSTCQIEKPLEQFNRDSRRNDGRRGSCRECQKAAQDPQKKREYHLKATYGITLKEYDELLEKQGGCCAICSTDTPQGGRFHVDHNHNNGEVRGLLCSNCNTALGLLQDNQLNLLNAVKYLQERGSYS